MTDVYKCPPSHKHSDTSTCFVHHRCRCDRCRKARSQYERARRRATGVDYWVPAGPTARRLQALACIGWSSKKIAALAGLSTGSPIARIREGKQPEVTASTEAKIAAIYDTHSTTPCTAPGSRQTAAWAVKHEWLGPNDWADIQRGAIRL